MLNKFAGELPEPEEALLLYMVRQSADRVSDMLQAGSERLRDMTAGIEELGRAGSTAFDDMTIAGQGLDDTLVNLGRRIQSILIPARELWVCAGRRAGPPPHGRLGDQINAVMSAVGYNLRLILKWLRHILCNIIAAIWAAIAPVETLKPAS